MDITNNVSWRSDNRSIATIDANGKASGVSEGKAIISASTGYQGVLYQRNAHLFVHQAKVSVDSTELTVLPLLSIKGLKVTPRNATIPDQHSKQYSKQYKAMVILSNGHEQNVTNDVSWRVRNTEIAVAQPSGKVHALDEGETQVIARLNYSGQFYKGEANVRVIETGD